MKAFTILLFLLVAIFSSAQENSTQKKLRLEAEKNNNTFLEDPEKALEKADLIIENAKSLKAPKAELTGMIMQTKYYRHYADYENMMVFARKLEEKAEAYKEPAYEVAALVYQSEIYFNNSQTKKCRETLEQALTVLDKSQAEDSLAIIGRSNVYVSLSNSYEDFETKLKYAQKSIELNRKYKKTEDLYRGYTHLAVIYYERNIDSATYYAQLSLDAGAKNEHVFINYIVLSKAELDAGNYQKVIELAQKADYIKGHKEWANLQSLYNNVIEAYEKMGDTENAARFKSKNDSLKILISEKQKKYLLRELNKKEEISSKSIVWIVSVVALILITALIYFLVKKRKRIEDDEERVWEIEYDYSKLVELLKKKDKSFMINFDEAFPDFSRKLLELNPKMVRTEIEFCALLKLKIPTKDIAIYTNVEAKTVRNKKYRIRKKLNISDGTDIYQWFHDF